MSDIDVGSIVPSTRDLLQVIATRRKGMALLALLGDRDPAENAARLHDLNISAFAFTEPGPAMQLAARATKTVPSLCLAPAGDRDALLRARYFGADGICVDATLPLDAWDKLAKGARMTRMLPLALASDAAGVEAAVKAGARALLVRASSADEVIALAAVVPKTMTVVGEVVSASAAALRSLHGHVDAALVPASVHTEAGFAELVVDLDP